MASGIEYHVRAILEAGKAAATSKRMEKFAAGLVSAGDKLNGVGDRMIGNTFQMVAGFGAVAASAVMAAGAAGIGLLVTKSIAFNHQLEQMQYGMASTLQLMGHSSGDFARNLDVSQAAMDELFKIAAKSPASFEQASVMFQNMLPGARAVTDNMQDILDLSKESLALGMIMGGDFATTGGQLSRILTGGAGAEFETWKVLQKPIMEAGKAAGYFNENLAMGSKLTEEFNRLSPEKRYELVRSATKELGVATEAFGGTWAGLTSTMLSDLQILQREVGKVAFENLKGTFKRMTGEGGVLDPGGKTMAKLMDFAHFLGSILAKGANWLANGFERFIEDFADNWQKYVSKAMDFADKLWRTAVMLGKAKVAAVGAGVGAKVIGGAAKGAGMAIQAFQQLWPIISKMGPWALLLIPAIAALGFALVGVGGIFAGIAAFIVSKWDDIVLAIQSGAVQFGPFFDAIDQLWAKLVALGSTFFNAGSTTDTLNNAVLWMATAVEWLTGAIATGLRVLGVGQFIFNTFTAGLKGIYAGFAWLGSGIAKVVSSMLNMLADAISRIPKVGEKAAAPLRAAANSVDGAMKVLQSTSADAIDGVKQDAQDAYSLFGKADVFESAFANAEDGVTKGFRGMLDSWIAPEKRELDASSLLAGTSLEGGAKGKGPAGGNVHIHKMVVQQDLRNQDPDRVIGAFYKAIDKSVRNRTQSLANAEQGI